MNKIAPGLVSVTFRKLSPADIVALCARAGIRAIEWGGDVHAPDADAARGIAAMMTANDMVTASYGSYYRAGKGTDFAPVLEAALALGAPGIRIWAGNKNPDEADAAYRQQVVADIQQACGMAAAHGISISTEYHGNTLTNTQASTLRLIDEVGKDNFYSYWQPLGNTTHEENIKNIGELCGIGKLTNIHAYHTAGGERRPFAEGAPAWADYFSAAAGRCGYALLEFVIDDDPEQFVRDAGALINLLNK